MINSPEASPWSNFENHLQQNPYPGRGIVVGMSEDGKGLIMVYWIMGRRQDSRNRIFEHEEGRVFTTAADPSKMVDQSLIIYDAMLEDTVDNVFVVSNGHQTEDVLKESCSSQLTMPEIFSMTNDWEYEPDAPNYTQRITAVVSLGPLPLPMVQMSILRKSRWDDSRDQLHFSWECIAPGYGFCITTYKEDGNPLPPFRGEPLLMDLHGTVEQIANDYWNALHPDNRVALAVKFIPKDRGTSQVTIINRFSKVEPEASV